MDKKKIGKANERKGKVKGEKRIVKGQGGRGVPQPHTGQRCTDTTCCNEIAMYG